MIVIKFRPKFFLPLYPLCPQCTVAESEISFRNYFRLKNYSKLNRYLVHPYKMGILTILGNFGSNFVSKMFSNLNSVLLIYCKIPIAEWLTRLTFYHRSGSSQVSGSNSGGDIFLTFFFNLMIAIYYVFIRWLSLRPSSTH